MSGGKSPEVKERAKRIRRSKEVIKAFSNYANTDLVKRSAGIKGYPCIYKGELRTVGDLVMRGSTYHLKLIHSDRETSVAVPMEHPVWLADFISDCYKFGASVKNFTRMQNYMTVKEHNAIIVKRYEKALAEKLEIKKIHSEKCARKYLEEAALKDNDNHALIYQAIKDVK